MISKEELGHDSLKNHLEFWDFMGCGMQGQQDLFPVHGLWRSHSSCWAGGDPAAPNGTMEILQLCRASWLDKESPKFMTLERAGGSLSLSGGQKEDLEFLWDILRVQQYMRNHTVIFSPHRISWFSFSLFPINMDFPIISIKGRCFLRPCQVTDDGNDF